VLRLLLALKRLEEQQQRATYAGVQFVLKLESRNAAYTLVLKARKLGLVETVSASKGGTGKKSVFGLSDKGREALR
jgi:hypothetical protein